MLRQDLREQQFLVWRDLLPLSETEDAPPDPFHGIFLLNPSPAAH
jgi:hypothetical protein